MTANLQPRDLPWSAYEARHGLRQAELPRPSGPTLTNANGTPAEPLPTEHPED